MSKTNDNTAHPINSISDSLKKAILPIATVMGEISIAKAPYESIAKTISDSLIYYNNFGVQAASVIGNMTSAISQMLNSFALSPIWNEMALMHDKWLERQKKQIILKRTIIERWNELNDELMHNNRYFPETEFFGFFDECTKDVSYMFRKGRILYRAREIDELSLPESVLEAVNTAVSQENESNFDNTVMYPLDKWDYLVGMSQDKWDDFASQRGLHSIDFWGYSAKESDAPTKSPSHGRINPKGISYLYTSLNAKTAISEIQPTIKELVSVAKIRTRERLNLFSFDFSEAFSNTELMKQPLSEFKSLTGMTFWELQIFFDTLSELFSKPALRNEDNYYATQYLSEYIKSKGFDGIKFKSSLRKGGYNIVLFDTSKDESGNPKNYEIVSSFLHYVKNVTVTSAKVMPKGK